MKNNILDLSCYLEKTMTVKMPDGRQYTLPKPTQRVFIKSVAISKLVKEGLSFEEQIQIINEFCCEIMNSNKQGKVFKIEEIQNMPIDAQGAIIEAYVNFAQELVNDPN